MRLNNVFMMIPLAKYILLSGECGVDAPYEAYEII
jgi:hypothetical protein